MGKECTPIKKRLSVFVVALLMMVLAACGANQVDEATAAKYTAKAEGVITSLIEGRYQELYEMFDDQMKAGLPVSQMEQQLPGIIQQSGTFEGFGQSSVQEKRDNQQQENYHVVTVHAKFSSENRIFTVTFNSRDQISGLFVK